MRRLLVLAGTVAAMVAAPAQAAPTPPTATTGSAKDVTQTTATLVASVTPNEGETTVKFEYGTSTAYGLETSTKTVAADAAATSVEIPVTGLTSATTYSFRVVATNAAGVTRGSNRTFRTAAGPSAPTASTSSAKDVTASGATLHGTAGVKGQATKAYFEYGTSTSYGKRTPDVDLGSTTGNVPVAAAIDGLASGTRYNYRLVVTAAAGVRRGANRSFITQKLPSGVSIVPTPNPVIYGGTLTVTGSVSGQKVNSIPVALELSSFPYTAGFRQIGNTQLTSSRGGYRFTVAPMLVGARVRVVTRTTPAARSQELEVASAVRVGLLAPQRLSGRRVRLSGSTFPALPEGIASLQRRTRFGWGTVRRTPLATAGGGRSTYRFTFRARRAGGIYRVKVTPNDGGAHITATSRERRTAALRRR